VRIGILLPPTSQLLKGNQNDRPGRAGPLSPARSDGAAMIGKYTDEMEVVSSSIDHPPHRRDWRDD
jgi:hypothetical protein